MIEASKRYTTEEKAALEAPDGYVFVDATSDGDSQRMWILALHDPAYDRLFDLTSPPQPPTPDQSA